MPVVMGTWSRADACDHRMEAPKAATGGRIAVDTGRLCLLQKSPVALARASEPRSSAAVSTRRSTALL